METVTNNELQKLKAISVYLPIFTDENFKFGEFIVKDGQFPYVKFSKPAEAFVQMAYDADWMYSFSWMDWQGTKEARRLLSDPEFLANASVTQLSKLITLLIRRDRFVEGELLAAYDNGLLLGIVRRAVEILKSFERSS